MAINLTDELAAKTTKGKIASAREVYLDGDEENLQQIGEKTHQIEKAVKDIGVTGGASTANAVSYDNTASGLAAVTAQAAMDELAAKNKAQDASISTKAESADVAAKMQTEQARVNAELEKKLDKASVVQELGDAEDKVVSQGALPFRYIENEEWLFAQVDAEDHLLFGIRTDGTPVFGKESGVEEQLRQDVNLLAERVATIMGDEDNTSVIDTMNELKKFFANIENTQNLTDILTKLDSVYNNLTSTMGRVDGLEEKTEDIAGKLDKTVVKDDEENVVQTPFRVTENEEWLHCVVDAEDHILMGIRRDTGKPYFPLNEMYHVEQNEEYLALWLDAEDHILMGIRRDGQIVGEINAVTALKETVAAMGKDVESLQGKAESTDASIELINAEISSLKEKVGDTSAVVLRNMDKIPALMSACRYNNGSQDLLLCAIADSHGQELSVRNAVELTNSIACIDAIIHCGDINAMRFDKNFTQTFFSDIGKCQKPYFVVVGNHDVGNTLYINYSATHEEVYEYFISPMVSRGILIKGEYQEGKSYYYHDFQNRKIRLIVVYEYDNPLDVADNEYWQKVDYDASAPAVVPGETYYVGDKVNCGGYIQGSFLCTKDVSTVVGQYDTTKTLPTYKSGRRSRCIMKEQADWLVETLKNTPSGYGIVIAGHNPAMLKSTNQNNYNFAANLSWRGENSGQYMMATDLFSDVVKAFMDKSKGTLNVVMNKECSYLNTLGSEGAKYAYVVDYDFSAVPDSYFCGFIGGHSHADLIFKHDSYEGMYAVNFTCSATDSGNRSNADIVNIGKDSVCYDALTCISFAKYRIGLSRLGNIYSFDGKRRDLEIIRTNN